MALRALSAGRWVAAQDMHSNQDGSLILWSFATSNSTNA